MLVVVGRDDAAAALSFRNLPEVQLIAPGELNAYDVLCNETIVFTESVLPSAAPVSAPVAEATEAPAPAAEPEATADDSAAEGRGDRRGRGSR